jgi:CRISPR/Cas system CSM-associated protein Csm3 (group 7 of RAMP superfamily)
MSWDIRQNPYNFVRFSERIVERDEDGNPIRVHDHLVFSGNSGYIECELINETPLICGGKHIREKLKDSNNKEFEHNNIKFFRINKRLAISSTSIKGMLRSFIEALTGSCIPIIDKVLSYRTFVNPGNLRCGMVIKKATAEIPGEIKEMRRIRVPINEVRKYSYGDKVNFTIQPGRLPRARINSINQGYLKKNNKNIETKRYERIFYNPTGKVYEFDIEEQDIYNRIVEFHMENWKRMKIPPGVTPTNYHKLRENDLIYFQVKNNKAINLCYIEVPRLAYRYSIGYFLEKDIPKSHCNEDDLCMSCRLFGYIKNNSARVGRVSVTHAIIINDDNLILKEKILKPLGFPHPTSVNLYLQDITNPKIVRDYNGAKIEERGDSFAPSRNDINEGSVRLRGRKFYWHHKKENKEILQQANFEEKTKLNSTGEILISKNAFKFKIYFYNLTDFELGLLLYALKLEGNMRHKLGMAKNLGFGTVKIEIKSLYIENMEKKYSSIDSDYPDDKTAEIDNYINQKFKSKISNFNNLPAVQDLKRILDPTQAPKNLGYPEEPDGRNYKWYMTHKNRPLPLLQEQ